MKVIDKFFEKKNIRKAQTLRRDPLIVNHEVDRTVELLTDIIKEEVEKLYDNLLKQDIDVALMTLYKKVYRDLTKSARM